MVAIWLIALTTSTAAPAVDFDALKKANPELFAAPQLPEWPAGLGKPIRDPNGYWLPADLGKATQQRLEACAVLPARCQARIDAIVPAVVDAIAKSTADVAVTADDAAEAKVKASKPQGFTFPVLAGVGVTSLIVGIVTGILLARVP